MGFLTTTFTTFVILFEGMELVFLSGKNAPVQNGQNVTIPGDTGYPPLQAGYEALQMQAIDKLNVIYAESLAEFFSVRTFSSPLTAERNSGRLHLSSISRCAMLLPFLLGGKDTMANILKRRALEYGDDPSWVSQYIETQLIASVSIYNLFIKPYDAVLKLYQQGGWPSQYADSCYLSK